MTIYKIFKYVAIVIGLVALFFALRVIIAGEDAIKASADLQASIVSPYIYIAYIVLAIAVFLALIFLIKSLFTGDIRETLFTLGGMAVIVLIAYLVTDGQATEMPNGEMLSASASHWVSTGLVIFYFLGIAAIGSMIFGGARKLTR